jgi:hypothetical protein
MAEDDLADDLLHGIAAIAGFLNMKPRQAYDLAEKGKLPLFKFGDRVWQGRKSKLRQHIEQLEAEQLKANGK